MKTGKKQNRSTEKRRWFHQEHKGEKEAAFPGKYDLIKGEITMNVMFVCTGNTCRSPMAVSLFTKRLNKEGRSDIQCRSAGLAACEGQGASWNAVEACKELGIDLTYHVAHRLRGGDFMTTDVFVVMEQVHKDILVGAGVNPGLVYILGGGIEDPYGKDLDAFIKCRDEIIASLDDLEDFLDNRAEEVYRKMGRN